MTTYDIRPIHAHEWPQTKALRLVALQDPVAPIAYLDSYEEAAARDDAWWQERAAGSSVEADRPAVRHFTAIARDDAGEETWVGSLVVLVERTGETDYFDQMITEDSAHVVGVYVHHDHRGAGLVDRLAEAGLAWARSLGLRRARLFVHHDNTRAQAAYRRLGFLPTGRTATVPSGTELEMAREL